MICLLTHPPPLRFALSPSTREVPNLKNSFFNPKPFIPRTCSFKFFCLNKDGTHNSFQVGQYFHMIMYTLRRRSRYGYSKDFSVLKSDVQYDSGTIFSTMAFYIFSLHIPLSFGGLSVVAEILRQDVLDPQTRALSLVLIQTVELIGAFLLLRYSVKPPYDLLSFSEAKEVPNERNWLMASVLGFGFLIAMVFLTSFVADRVIGPKDVNSPILKEILSSGSISTTACTFVYCILTPILEETIYRGFLLTSLASTMDWQKAVIISSAVFSAIHLSAENSIQLFIIGSILGCSYCWSGKLSSPILIHSLYNALTLFITIRS